MSRGRRPPDYNQSSTRGFSLHAGQNEDTGYTEHLETNNCKVILFQQKQKIWRFVKNLIGSKSGVANDNPREIEISCQTAPVQPKVKLLKQLLEDNFADFCIRSYRF